MKVIIEIQENNTGKALLEFLKQLPFIKLTSVEIPETKSSLNIENVFGIWKDRNITKSNLREKAWKM